MFMRFRPTIQTALLGLVGIPLVALFLELAYDTSKQRQADVAEAYRVAAAINDISASQTEQFLSRAEYVLTELSRRPEVQALDRANCDPLLADWKQLQPAYANILTLDTSGHLVCSATGIQPGQAAGPDPKYYFAETVRTGQFTVGKPAKGFVTGRWVSTLAYPIRNGAGQVIGVVAASVDLAQYQLFAHARNLPPAGVAGIINGEGTIISRSEDAEQRVGLVSDAVSTRVMLAQRRGVTRSRDYKGIDRLYAFTQIPRSDWIAFTSLDTASVLAPAQRLAQERLAFAIAIMVAIAALTLWVSRRIAKPVQAISKTILALTQGDPDARPTAGGPLEIHQIAVEFSAMLDALAIATEALRVSLARSQTIIQTAMDGFWLADLQGRLLQVNATYCRMSGYSEQELLGKTISDLVAKESVSEAESHMQAIMTKGWDRFETRHRRKDGSTFDVDASVQYQALDGGRMVWFLTDITERKRVQQESSRQMDELLRWQELTIGREDRMLQLKAEVNELLARQGQPIRYSGEGDS